MPYETPDFTAIRARMLRDALNLDPDAHTAPDSDLYVRSSVTASAAEGLYAHQAWMVRQIMPDSADSDYLELHAGLRGLTRKPATPAQGTARFTGLPGALVPAGTKLVDAEGYVFLTLASGVLDATGLALSCRALVPGALPDSGERIAVLADAPEGVDGQAALAVVAGTDAEDDASLRGRLLLRMADPPGGGTAADYVRWALEIPGIAAARVFPLLRGAGTVDVVVMGDDALPAADAVAAAQSHIDGLRPVAADVVVRAPGVLSVDVTLGLGCSGTATLESLRPEVEAALRACFAASGPGDGIMLSKLLAAVAALPGVADAAVLEPRSNIVPQGALWPRLGAVTLTAV